LRAQSDAVQKRLSMLEIETPSWGFADSGTRFGVFPQAEPPLDVFERVNDAALVHRLTGTAPAVALHFPWDAVDDLGSLHAHIETCGLRAGAVNPKSSKTPTIVWDRSQPRSRDQGESRRAPPGMRAYRSRTWLFGSIALAGRRHQLRGPGRLQRTQAPYALGS